MAQERMACAHPSSTMTLLHSRGAEPESAKSCSTTGCVAFSAEEPSSRSSGLGFAGNRAIELVASATASMLAAPSSALPSRPGLSRSVKPPVHSDARRPRSMSSAERHSEQRRTWALQHRAAS